MNFIAERKVSLASVCQDSSVCNWIQGWFYFFCPSFVEKRLLKFYYCWTSCGGFFVRSGLQGTRNTQVYAYNLRHHFQLIFGPKMNSCAAQVLTVRSSQLLLHTAHLLRLRSYNNNKSLSLMEQKEKGYHFPFPHRQKLIKKTIFARLHRFFLIRSMNYNVYAITHTKCTIFSRIWYLIWLFRCCFIHFIQIAEY